MSSTKSVNELAEKWLGSGVNGKFDEIDVISEARETATPATTTDELIRRYLSSKVAQELSKVDVKAGGIEFGLQVKEFRIYLAGKGLVLFLMLLLLAAYLLGASPFSVPLQSILNGLR